VYYRVLLALKIGSIIGVLLLAPFLSFNAFGQMATIEISSYESNIGPSGKILVLGTISGATPYVPVKLSVADPSGNVIYAPNVAFDGNGNFKYMINPTLPQFAMGTYTVTASHKDSADGAQFQFVVGTPSKSSPITEEADAVIPEFGPLASVILSVSIVGIILMTARYRGLGFPRV
jgi:predicted secreted protein with PEFG-CTERM motif